MHDCLYEAAVMQHVREHGYPAPRVFEVSGSEIVMERIDGPTMLTEFGSKPWNILKHARTIGQLLHLLHSLPAPDWLRRKHDTGETIVHMDLHPDNVMLTSDGPIVIDWTNAGIGNAAAEVADLWLVSANAEIPGGRVKRTLLGLGRGLFVRTLIKQFDRDEVRAQLEVALGGRLNDRNMREGERARMSAFVERWAL